MVDCRLLPVLAIAAVLLSVRESCSAVKRTTEAASKSKHTVLASKRYANEGIDIAWRNQPLEDEDSDDDDFDSDSSESIDKTSSASSRSVEWPSQVSPTKKHSKSDFNSHAQAKSILPFLPLGHLSKNEICRDVRCQPDEYCFAPELGIAECLKRPLALGLSQRTTDTSDMAHRTLFIDIDNTNLEREEENEDDSEEEENVDNGVKNAPFKRDNESYDDNSDDEDAYEAKKNSDHKFNSITNQQQSRRKSKVNKKSEKFDDNDNDKENESENIVSNEFKRVEMQNLKVTKNSSKNYLPSESQSTAFNNSKIVQCPSCRFGRSRVVCGTDNSSYSSLCRLEFHNCVHQSNVKLACLGFCPCPANPSNRQKSTRQDSSGLKSQYYTNWFKEKTRIKLKKNAQNQVLSSKDMHKYHYFMSTNNENNVNQDKLNKSQLNEISKRQTCSNEQLRSMGLRLLDWFLVVMNEELKRKSTQVGSDRLPQSKQNQTTNKLTRKKPLPGCEEQASFMFFHFDTDQDFKLSVKELYYLEHDENEHCLEPYLNQCDEDGNHYLTVYEWCSCFSLRSKPCGYHVKHMIKQGLIGGYVPQCTEQGHYQKVQCHASTNYCWCSDKNGNEIAGTRIRGRPVCDKTYPLNKNRFYKNKYINNGDTSKAATASSSFARKPNDKVDPYSDLIIDMEDGDVDEGDNFHFDNGSGSDSF